MPRPELEDGKFDGAMFNPRDFRSPKEIVDFVHSGSRLGLVRQKHGHFVAEFLEKRSLSWSTTLAWEDSREPTICERAEEALSLISDYANPEEA